jgi:aspartate/glutamate racemase
MVFFSKTLNDSGINVILPNQEEREKMQEIHGIQRLFRGLNC